MPLPVERLRPDSATEVVQQAISDSIAQCVQEGGRDQAQCSAMVNEIAKRATRSGSGPAPTRQVRAGLGDRGGSSGTPTNQ